jgi:hypothetical protein
MIITHERKVGEQQTALLNLSVLQNKSLEKLYS